METAALQGDFAQTQKEKESGVWMKPRPPTAATQAFSVLVEGARLARGRKEEAAEQRALPWGERSPRSLPFLPLCPPAMRLGHNSDGAVCDRDDG